MTAHIDERFFSSTLGLIQLAQEAFGTSEIIGDLEIWVDAGFASPLGIFECRGFGWLAGFDGTGWRDGKGEGDVEDGFAAGNNMREGKPMMLHRKALDGHGKASRGNRFFEGW